MSTITGITSNLTTVAGLSYPGSPVDINAIFDAATLKQVFYNARPMKATIREPSKIMEHPAENGIVIADHRITMPVEIEIPMMVNSQYYRAVYKDIKKAFSSGDKFIVQTRVESYRNMVISDIPHEETPDIYDSILIGLRFKQILYAEPTGTFSPVNPSYQDTVSTGLQAAKTPSLTAAQQQKLNDYLKYVRQSQ